MKKIIMLITITLSAVLYSCNRKMSPVYDLEDLAEELKEDSQNYTSEEWRDAKIRYEEACEYLQKYEYTDEELRHIGKLKMRCGIYLSKGAVHEFTENMKDIIEEGKGALEELQEIMNNDNNDLQEE